MSEAINKKTKSVESINNTLQLLSASGQEKDREVSSDSSSTDTATSDMNGKSHPDKDHAGNELSKQKKKRTHPGVSGKKIGKRHRRKMTGEPMKRVSEASIRRLFQRAGSVRVQKLAYLQAKEILREITDDVINDALELMALGKRKTIKVDDVIEAIKRKGNNLYGYA